MPLNGLSRNPWELAHLVRCRAAGEVNRDGDQGQRHAHLQTISSMRPFEQSMRSFNRTLGFSMEWARTFSGLGPQFWLSGAGSRQRLLPESIAADSTSLTS